MALITITTGIGCCGPEIAHLVADGLGIPLYDDEKLREESIALGLSPRELKSLFPAGYTKGACRLAGITFRDRFMDYYGENLFRRVREVPPEPAPAMPDKEYRVDAFGFLIDPSEWDEDFAENKAHEMKVPGGLSERHQEILLAIRRLFSETGTVPSVSEACEALSMEMDEMERLFPDGYVRGAVKIAGLSMK